MLKDYSSLILRFGLGLTLFWFGITSILEPEVWSSLVPSFIPIQPTTTIFLLAIFQVIISIFIIIGLFTRIAALLMALSLIPIILSLGYNDVAVRDFAIFMAAISLAMSGSKKLSIDSKFRD
ncbi:MAG: DoxX family membrane protein [Nanoarchaeota archaeon]